MHGNKWAVKYVLMVTSFFQVNRMRKGERKKKKERPIMPCSVIRVYAYNFTVFWSLNSGTWSIKLLTALGRPAIMQCSKVHRKRLSSMKLYCLSHQTKLYLCDIKQVNYYDFTFSEEFWLKKYSLRWETRLLSDHPAEHPHRWYVVADGHTLLCYAFSFQCKAAKHI